MKYDVNSFDERSYQLPLDEVGFDKLAVRANILPFSTQEIVGAYHLVSRFDELVNQPGAHEPRSTRHQHSFRFQTIPPLWVSVFGHIGTRPPLEKCSMQAKCQRHMLASDPSTLRNSYGTLQLQL